MLKAYAVALVLSTTAPVADKKADVVKVDNNTAASQTQFLKPPKLDL